MAKLPDEILTTIFSLQRQLVEGIDEAAAAESMIFEQFGETEVKRIPDPEKVKRTVERLRESNRQLELVTLALDELIIRIDSDLNRQRRTRLQGNYRN
jgi:hypothetical protein